MTDTIYYPLSAVAEQCPTCGIWTYDVASCRRCDRAWAERSRAVLTERLAALEAAHPTAWPRVLAANLAIAGGLQLAYSTGVRFGLGRDDDDWHPSDPEPHPRFR